MKGILVGTDKNQEWLLPWWWSIYSKYNDFPVAFADFGMTPEAREWCSLRGEVIPVEPVILSKRPRFSPKRMAFLQEKHQGNFLEKRAGWFQKPFACMKSPFDVTAWIDLDCEVACHLQLLFDAFDPRCEVAAVRQRNIPHCWTIYNSGVLIFKKNAPLMKKWAEACLRRHHRFVADDNILSSLVRKESSSFQELPPGFNWCMTQGYNCGAVIFHWMGSWGKQYIRTHGGIHAFCK